VQGHDLCSEQWFRASAKIIDMGCSLTFLLVRRILGFLRLGPGPMDERLSQRNRTDGVTGCRPS
jgi:hypothetical protein